MGCKHNWLPVETHQEAFKLHKPERVCLFVCPICMSYKEEKVTLIQGKKMKQTEKQFGKELMPKELKSES